MSSTLQFLLELAHLNRAFHVFTGTEMLGNHRFWGFYRNNTFYFIFRWKKKVIFVLFQNKIEEAFYNSHIHVHVCWMVPAHFQQVKNVLVRAVSGVE